MYCAKCGSQLVASANYCHVCGAKIGGQTQATNPVHPVYEVCETTFTLNNTPGLFGRKGTWQWIGMANGPKGEYAAAVSSEFKAPSWLDNLGNGPDHHDVEAKAALNQLVSMLLSDGWEPVGNDVRFPKFRRRIN